MGGNTLLVRHLPSSLTKEEKEDFLRHFGAVRVRVMGSKGPLKHTAFAEFPNKDVASQVLAKLHQVELLGCRLVVELAHSRDSQHFPTTTDSQPNKIKEEAGDEEKKKEEKEEEDQEDNAFDFSFHQWGLKYPRRRRLYYLYPPPSPSILANISNALAACPKLYVQVLHLMNKMDLPAPFGPVTAQPPLAPDVGVAVDYEDKLQLEEMDVSSTEESELESDTEAVSRPNEEAPRKRKPAESRRQIKKRARLAMAMFQTTPATEAAKPSAPAPPLREVFEQTGDGAGQRRIQLRLPGAVTDAPASSSMPEGVVAPPPEPGTDEMKDTTTDTAAEMASAPAQSSGFGVITPVVKATEESEDKGEEEGWSETKFISKSELRKGRLSRREMDDLSIFRNYKEGEPSRRLYIKNLAKQVTEEDLHWIFGRYVNWDNEEEKNIFDIRLMKEGRMKGQAFITLGTDQQALKALRDTNAFVFKGKPMAVHFARSAKQQEEGKS